MLGCAGDRGSGQRRSSPAAPDSSAAPWSSARSREGVPGRAPWRAADSRPRRSRRSARGRAGGDLDDPDSMASRPRAARRPSTSPPDLGQRGTRSEFVRGNATGDRERAAGVPQRRRRRARPLRHRGRAARRRAACARSTRPAPSAARFEGPVLARRSAGRAGRPPRARRPDSRPRSLRPRLVWGAGDTTLLPEIVAAVEAGRSPGSAAGGTVTDDDPRRQRRRGPAARRRAGRSAREAYFVTDGERGRLAASSSSELLRRRRVRAADPLGRRPGSPSAVAAELGGRLGALLRLGGEPPLTAVAPSGSPRRTWHASRIAARRAASSATSRSSRRRARAGRDCAPRAPVSSAPLALAPRARRPAASCAGPRSGR